MTTHNSRLQSGLDTGLKSQRVANYHNNLVKEVASLAHSCGVSEPRQFTRHHVRKVQSVGRSKSMAELFPDISETHPYKSFKGIKINHQ